MKKIILILLLILPVVVTSLTYLLAGFIGRGLTVVPISGVAVDYQIAQSHNVFPRLPDESIFELTQIRVNNQIDLRTFITAQPVGARFEKLLIEVAYLDGGILTGENPPITVNEQGILKANSVESSWIEVRIGDGWNIFMTIWILGVSQ